VSELTAQVRKIDRKLDIHRGLKMSFEELGLLVSTGAYAELQAAARKHREEECRKLQNQRPPRVVA
jgi:hypothetical protein